VSGPDLTVEVQYGLAWYYCLLAVANLLAAAWWTFWGRGQDMLWWEKIVAAAAACIASVAGWGWPIGVPAAVRYFAVTSGVFMLLMTVLAAALYRHAYWGASYCFLAGFFQILGVLYFVESGPVMPVSLRDAIDSVASPLTLTAGAALLLAAFLYFRVPRLVRISPKAATTFIVILFLAALMFGPPFPSGGNHNAQQDIGVGDLVTVAVVWGTVALVCIAVLLRYFSVRNRGHYRYLFVFRCPFGFTDPRIAFLLCNVALIWFGFSLTDYDFRKIVGEPDNVAIVFMLLAVAFFVWLGLYQASRNDMRLAQGLCVQEASDRDHVLTWPDLVYIELIAAIVCLAVLIVWGMVLKAPLEEWANPNETPNPSKAPWYFVGLQELLVYFDPWLAGVVIPGLIIFGLMALPYLDVNPEGAGYYTFNFRRFAISTFLFGFLLLWLLLIVIGTFLRGPGWTFVGPYETWDPQAVTVSASIDLADLFWIDLLGRPKPEYWLLREFPGIVLLLAYFVVLPIVLSRTILRDFRKAMGRAQFTVFMLLFLTMGLLPVKMILRWTLNIKYIIHFVGQFSI